MSKSVKRKPLTKAQRAALKRKKRLRTAILIGFEFVLIMVLVVIIYGVTKVNQIERPGTEEFKQENVAVNEDITSEVLEVMESYQTIAVFGLDNRANGNLSSGNSDVIMIVTINNETKEVRICSVYRDTYLDTGEGKFRKCNDAYNAGGAERALSMLNKNLDLNITEYITVDFNAIVECIDLLGGIEMTLTEEETIWMIGHIDEINEMTKRNSPQLYERGAGTYNLDGVQACAYARVRQTLGDDYKRTERQRAVVAAMVKKAQSSNLATVDKLIDTMFGYIQTSFSNMELLSLASQIFNYQLGDMAGFPFKKNSITLTGKGDVVVACTLEENVTELHRFLYDDLEYTPSTTVIANSKKIVQDTGYDEKDGV